MNAAPSPNPATGSPPPADGAVPITLSVTVQPPAAPATPLTLPELPAKATPVPPILNAWPRSAQWATAVLLVLATGLLIANSLGSLRWGSRPTELERGLGYRIDLNNARRAELMQLPGVGPKLAQAIEDYRHEHGKFAAVEDLLNVPGVGPTRLECWRPWIWVGSEEVDDEEKPAAPAREPMGATRKPAAPMKNVGERKGALKKEAGLVGKIDINRASPEELRKLPGIGPKLAQRIVAQRRQKAFQAVEDLRRVPGIGVKTMERLRPHVTFGRAGGPQGQPK